MLESTYQARLIKKLRNIFPGIVVLKNDSSYLQGMLDLTLLFGNRWAALEVKASEDAPFQPNQLYYLELLHEMSYAAVIFPGNEDEVIRELQFAFGFDGSCLTQPVELPLGKIRR